MPQRVPEIITCPSPARARTFPCRPCHLVMDHERHCIWRHSCTRGASSCRFLSSLHSRRCSGSGTRTSCHKRWFPIGCRPAIGFLYSCFEDPASSGPLATQPRSFKYYTYVLRPTRVMLLIKRLSSPSAISVMMQKPCQHRSIPSWRAKRIISSRR